MSLSIPFSNTYATLPSRFYAAEQAEAVRQPQLIKFNDALAKQLGIDTSSATAAELAAVFSGNELPAKAAPLAMAYAGHQFGYFNPRLGDGRAILLGDLIDTQGQRRDIHLKGTGLTAFSRGGDGRSPLGPAIREYILCEAMHALGVPTTRALALVATGEKVLRERLEPGGIFTRVGASHIRVGTFQYFQQEGDTEALQILADHVIERHYAAETSQCAPRSAEQYQALYHAICQRQAELVARWMALGFIHGVMNTDNMTVSGETIDYGPCAFMDIFKADQVFSSIDKQGRYAYVNQPGIAQWNLARLGEALLPLLAPERDAALGIATEIVQAYPAHFQQAWQRLINAKIGLASVEPEDRAFTESLLVMLEKNQLDFTRFFRRLTAAVVNPGARDPLLALLDDAGSQRKPAAEQALHEWLDQWQALVAQREPDLAAAQHLMSSHNPVIIPRNHQVASAIKAAEKGDYSVFETLLAAVTDPFSERAEYAQFELPPEPAERVLKTFCGT